MIRLVQLAIVAFWIVMTVMLVLVVYFPEETRLTQVPASRVFASFLANRNPSHLVILDGGREVGSVTVSHKRESERGDGSASLVALAGSIKAGAGIGADTTVSFMIQVWLDARSQPTGVRFAAQVPATSSVLTVESRRGKLSYRAVRDGTLIADSEEGKPVPGSLDAQIKLLMAAFGVDLDSLDREAAAGGNGEGGDGGAAPNALAAAFRPVARQGSLTIGKLRFPAYTLEIPGPMSLEGRLRFIFTKKGELLKIDGFLNYEVVADLFRPGAEPIEAQ